MFGPMLDLRRLTVLRAVAREGSFSAAARALDYTQPAISHHIARLEEEVGTALLHRSPRGVTLTEAGEALVQHADAVITRLDAAQEEVAEIAGLRSGRVRVAAFPSGSATLFPAAARSLRDSSPGVRVSLIEAEPPEALGLLRSGDVDLALTFGYPESVPPRRGELEFEPLFDDQLCLVTGVDTKARRSRLADFKDEAWIAGCERCRAHLLHLAAQAGFEPQIVYATDDYVTVQSLVAAGLGVTVLPSLALQAHRRPDVRVIPLGSDAMRQIAAVVLAGPRRPPAIAAMVAAMRRAGQEGLAPIQAVHGARLPDLGS
jgi:DNA-binding transcriptional LysR family regulator